MNDEKVKQWQMAPLHAPTDLGVQAGSLSDIAEFVGLATTAYFAFELLPRYRVRRAIVLRCGAAGAFRTLRPWVCRRTSEKEASMASLIFRPPVKLPTPDDENF
jgi:hypothetical protein